MVSETQRRTTGGYIEHIYGEPPVNARSSSTPRRDDAGYTIREHYPANSRMGREHSDYKHKQKVADTANREYRRLGGRLAAPALEERDGMAYGAVRGKFYYPEDHSEMLPMARRAKETSTMYVPKISNFISQNLTKSDTLKHEMNTTMHTVAVSTIPVINNKKPKLMQPQRSLPGKRPYIHVTQGWLVYYRLIGFAELTMTMKIGSIPQWLLLKLLYLLII